MESSDDLMTLDNPWAFRTSLSDDWISDIYTNPLQMSFSPLFNPPLIRTPTSSGCSNNEKAAAASIPPVGGRVAKRKPRPSKRAKTTFIEADAVNFRRMVQQVTGERFDGVPVLKPEPRRAINRAHMGGGFPAAGNGNELESYYSFPTLESYAIN